MAISLLNRDIRNDLEHFDERLQTWYERSANRNRVDMSLGPTALLREIGGVEGAHRNLDPETLEFSFQGRSIDLRNLAEDLAEIRRAADSWLRIHDWSRAVSSALRPTPGI